jgi:DNA-binding CsgD family transcriptional regulator
MGMVERYEELRVLEELFDADRRGAGSVVLIEGAAGTGKTGLLHIFAEHAANLGAAFLSASASRIERDLPLSAVGQLFREPALSAGERRRAEPLLRDGAIAAMAHGVNRGPDATVQVPAPILGGLSEVLLKAAERAPLVIGVDDIHHADVPSLQFLLYLARRAGSARVLLVLTECLRATRSHSPLRADLLRLPGTCRLRLKLLSQHGVGTLLAERLAPAAAQRLTPECHLASGGNPLLVQVLVEDHLMSGPADSDGLVFGSAFRQAVLTCLYDSDAELFARGVAVLGGDACAPLLGELTQLDTESTGLLRHVLRATGLLDETGFRHSAVQAAVLSGMRSEQRTALFSRAAELLYDHGASATAVADRLMAADQARFPWGVQILRDAAEQADAAGRLPTAIGYLRLALRDCAEEDLRLAVRLDLVRAEWRMDPAIAARHLPELTRAIRKGRLPAESVATLIGMMLWLGRVDDALETLAEVLREGGEVRAEAVRSDVPQWWLRDAYPGLGGHELFTTDLRAGADIVTPLRHLLTTSALASGRSAHCAYDQMIAEAERILQESVSTFKTLAPLVALETLICLDELERAELWCDAFGKSAEQWPPLGTALIMSLRAAVHLRRGELHDAVRCASEALDLVSAKGWGVAIGFPVSTMVCALTAMGEYAEARKSLDVPIPEAMSQTPLVLPYLQARGRYYLAVGSPLAALAELRACGELMTEWGLDLPGFVPWRSDMAEVYLRLNRPKEARDIASEQLLRVARYGRRTRGLTLYALACASCAEERPKLLRTAVELLEEVGGRVELARALAAFGETQRASGHPGAAEALERRADLLLTQCGAEGVKESLSPRRGEGRGREEAPDPLMELSEAERRVAAFAANGYTNRQIARRLHVTMSTVEQHLTRVYRKLNITRRTELPMKLTLLSPEFPA